MYQVIEDELIISLPMVAYHDHSCIASYLLDNETPSGEDKVAAEQRKLGQTKANPFQVLEQLKAVSSLTVDSIQSDT